MAKKKNVEPVCPVCGTKCRKCNRPAWIPENPKLTIDQVLVFTAKARMDISTQSIADRFGCSLEDASNRLRKLLRSGLVEVSGRLGRQLLYQVSGRGKKMAEGITLPPGRNA